MGLFMVWLKFTPPAEEAGAVVRGPGTKPVRSEGRINRVLTAVRGSLTFAVDSDEAPT
jgi:hypothetical protein